MSDLAPYFAGVGTCNLIYYRVVLTFPRPPFHLTSCNVSPLPALLLAVGTRNPICPRALCHHSLTLTVVGVLGAKRLLSSTS
uniref:Uncharacterized protein n=1 Tax=Steinernema glaseri TaxID=37863 RepID=A0A1I7YEI9_9BILA